MDLESNRDKQLVIPLFETVVFPKTGIKFRMEKAIGKGINEKAGTNPVTAIALVVRENSSTDVLEEASFYKVGALVRLESIQPADNGYLLNVRSLERVAVENIEIREDGVYADYSLVPDIEDVDENSRREMIGFLKNTIKEIGANFRGSELFLKPLEGMDSVDEIIGFALPYITVPLSDKQELLEMSSLRERSLKFIDMLLKQKENVNLQIEMAKKFSEQTNKSYRESLLRQQLKAIQEELNEADGASSKAAGYEEKIEGSDMPEEVKKTAREEFNKLKNMGENNPENHIIRNYLDLLIALPWKTQVKKEIDIEQARRILDEQHHGLKKVKERIIQHLAVMKLKQDKQGSILLFVGPPGTGKTSLGKSIAEALDRKYIRASLGGVRDEAEIRGHRRTYIGALPGRIIQGIKKAGEKNPIFVLDEIDKLSHSYAGDPASALLEVLDPEQNHSFSDHYLEVPYDLSDVLFIATANSLSTVPAPLLDRTEVIHISSYTNREKFAIGRDHLIPQVLEEHGLDGTRLEIDESALRETIEKYTREAGVRGLKQKLSHMARFASEKIVSGGIELPYRVEVERLEEILGIPIVRQEEARKENIPGVVTGLAWTPVGGDILFVEATFMGGNGTLTLTGQLGDVMKESAKISLSLIRSRLAHAINNFDFVKNDIHIHVPSGATPKDGPSAGLALFTALASLMLGKKVDAKLAMTGEITLRGSVLPVGGIKEKLLAAHRAGIKRIVLPKENEKDLIDVPDDVKNELTIRFVETIEEALKEALNVDLPMPEFVLSTSDQGRPSLV
ncbi:MAG: endopeptidase La [Proteobacteria bacterium]|nr:endopeptidase La [Pseudomonadota bacterium]